MHVRNYSLEMTCLYLHAVMTVSTVDKVYILPDTTTRSPPTMMSTSPTQASTTHITLPGSGYCLLPITVGLLNGMFEVYVFQKLHKYLN